MLINFGENEYYKAVSGLWKYDYGQKLEITGLNITAPTVEVDFSLSATCGDSLPRIGVNTDGIVTVPIPDSMLEYDAHGDYNIYAFIYVRTAEEGRTTHRIALAVKDRPKPEPDNIPENVFAQVLEQINTALAEMRELASSGGTGTTAPGKNGREIELQKSATHIQWRYVGDPDWQNLIALEELKGPAGHAGTVTQEDIADAVVAYFNAHPLPSLDGYATEAWANARFLTEHQDISGLAPKNHNHDGEYLKEHQSLDGYATEDWVSQQGYLTEHQDVSGKADKTDLHGHDNKDVLDNITADHLDQIDTNTADISQLKEDMGQKSDANHTHTDYMTKTGNAANKNVTTDASGNIVFTDMPIGGEGGVEVDAELREYYTTAKQAIRESIVNKGVAVSDADSLASYAEKIAAIPSAVEPTEDIPIATKLVATELQETNGIKLVWEDVNAHGYLVKRKQTGEVNSTADGTTVYNGTALEFTDTTATKGNTYFYRIFPYNSKNQYNAVPDGQEVTVTYKNRAGQKTVGELEIDDVIKFGEYEGNVLEWKVKDTITVKQGYISLVCEQNLGNLWFDAPENNAECPNPISNRKNQGNNRWAVSNVRQILNSEADKNAWFSKQHEYDNAPNYANKAGFLKDFTEYEKNILYKKTNICVLDANDGGGTESVLDRIWLPSTFEIGSEIPLPFENDHVFNGFSDNTSRAYQSNWWTRTINNATSAAPNSASNVRNVISSGGLYANYANYYIAVRPFCSLPASAYVRWSDSDNAHIFADDSLRNA